MASDMISSTNLTKIDSDNILQSGYIFDWTLQNQFAKWGVHPLIYYNLVISLVDVGFLINIYFFFPLYLWLLSNCLCQWFANTSIRHLHYTFINVWYLFEVWFFESYCGTSTLDTSTFDLWSLLVILILSCFSHQMTLLQHMQILC